jgi:cellobiose-specific phosphotransferase system component IIA
MTVSAYPRDHDGAALSTSVTARTTAYNAIPAASASAKATAAQALDQAQRELVNHYLGTGRLLASSILSTMT